MNHFAHTSAAERYARGRPFFHRLAIEKIAAICCDETHIHRALDVACGPGQSAIALSEVADQVIGLDNSAEMLSQAWARKQVHYVRARAEQLPFPNGCFNLLTVGLAFHWFDRPLFLSEARRTLQTSGWLVIYNDVFCGRMNGNPDFEAWHRNQYLVRYPTPPRNNAFLSSHDALDHGFTPPRADEFVHEVEFTPDQLVNYLLTQTNVIAAVEGGTEPLGSVQSWLRTWSLSLFRNQTEMFPFSCYIQFLRAV